MMNERERRRPNLKPSKQPLAKTSGAESPWSFLVPVDEIPSAGRHVTLTANADERAAVAQAAGVVAISRLEATFDLAPFARDGVHVAGVVAASVEQTCVITLEPVTSAIEEPIDLIFMPAGEPGVETSKSIHADDAGAPDILENGMIDLGAVAAEHLILGIDPYPRKPGVAFDAPPEKSDPTTHPFAALAALKKDNGSNRG